MSFIKFITRRTGFGRTSWYAFALIQLMCFCIVAGGVLTWKENGWVSIVMAVAIELTLLYGTWKNYKGEQA